MSRPRTRPEGGERVLKGLGVSPGIGIGTAHLRGTGTVDVPLYRIAAAKVEAEQARLRQGVRRSLRQISSMRAKARNLPASASEELGFLFDAYSQMLKDSRLVRGALRRIAEDRINAEAAVEAEMTEIARGFAALDDDYIASRIEDIRDVSYRLVGNLAREASPKAPTLPKGSIIVAEDLSPADTMQLDPARVSGIATTLGGAEGHTAIMARALGLPAVLGVPGLLREVRPGDPLIVDGDGGLVIINPTPARLQAYERRHKEQLRETRRLARLRRLPAITKDGKTIRLQANMELPIEMNMVLQSGAEGIGLLRSEFLFMNREDLPSEEEQYQALKEVVARMEGRPVTIRTLDVGAEKDSVALRPTLGDSLPSPLGLRGIRLSLARIDLLETQFRAILRAGAHGNVRILLPMITNVSEIRRAREVLKKAAGKLKRRKVPMAETLPPVGVMIEVPGAALAADALARDSDFFSIGSNDLTMYTLAIDRSDEQVADLYDPIHPAVLRLIQFSAEAGLRARIPVAICGEMAGDPRYTALLLGLGFRELSMTASSIPRVKQRVRSLDLSAAERRARVIMDQVDSGRIAALLDDFNALA